MKKFIYLYGIAITLLVMMSSCNHDVNDLHEKWMQDGELNYVGKIDSLTALGGNKRIEFQTYLSDQRVKFLNITWSELGVDTLKRVPVPEHEIDEMFSIILDESDGIKEKEYTFEFVSDDDKGTQSIPFTTIGKVYGPKYQESLKNRLVTGFEEKDNGIYLKFSAALNSDDQGIELTYNNGTKNQTLTYTPEDLKERIFLESPDFSSPITYFTLYKPANSLDTFKAEVVVPPIEKSVNIALGKPGKSSKTLASKYSADQAVDGIIGDNSSRWINAREVGTHWIEIDFEDTYNIEEVIIYDDTPISDFVLQIEVNGVWEDLQTVTGNTHNVFTAVYEGISANKIRYQFESTDPLYISRLFELEVYSTVKIQ